MGFLGWFFLGGCTQKTTGFFGHVPGCLNPELGRSIEGHVAESSGQGITGTDNETPQESSGGRKGRGISLLLHPAPLSLPSLRDW